MVDQLQVCRLLVQQAALVYLTQLAALPFTMRVAVGAALTYQAVVVQEVTAAAALGVQIIPTEIQAPQTQAAALAAAVEPAPAAAQQLVPTAAQV